jgi:hypothetical protein
MSTVTRFAIKKGDEYLLDDSSIFFTKDIFRAKLFGTSDVPVVDDDEYPVMVTITYEEQPYNVG